MLLNCVIGAVGGHHIKLDEDWEKAAQALKGGCGQSVQTLLTHPDMKQLFLQQLCKQETTYSLVKGETTYIGDKRVLFNLQSNSWCNRLKQDAEWWRFAAVVKALVVAADVVGSAILPERQSPKKYVVDTLSRRISNQQMRQVVQSRLKGKELREFQKAIASKKGRITLVEAGCGTGKTVAAYMWAEHHAHGKKLFFCYPTTGTATEGFLGYVHETKVEAELIHSRAIVDLEGIAEVPDDENGDHLLRIESLNAWSPQVVICTADTVLALVRNNRRGLYNSPAILSAAFVFDELHAYDNLMFEAVVALIKALPGASFLLMTASLPKVRKEFLLKHLDVEEVLSPIELEEIPRYKFQRIGKEEAFEKAAAAVAQKERVLWICNTVARAQATLKNLQKMKVATRTYHSRFKYKDRVRQHRKIVRWFSQEKRRWGIVAVTNQVAEMSLDLDADILISEIAPIPALIQRLGRLNRRVTPENHGSLRKAYFINPDDFSPYKGEELLLAEQWIEELRKSDAISQADLSKHFNQLSPATELRWDVRTAWLDSGWFARPEQVRDISNSVLVLMEEDKTICQQNTSEIIKCAIPMNYNNLMKNWQEWKNHLLAPVGSIYYDKKIGAILL